MKLYIDESGNTGETLVSEGGFNFQDQPYYVLAGIFVSDEIQADFQSTLSSLKTKYRIQGVEFKSKSIYEGKDRFVEELVDYLLDKSIPFFIEIMDKSFYLNIQLVDHFILPYSSLPITERNVETRRQLASSLGEYVNPEVHQRLIDTVKSNSNNSIEEFYDYLIDFFNSLNLDHIKIHIQQTKQDYMDMKIDDPSKALESFLPIPDKNPKDRLIHLLPNYNAFTNLIGRGLKLAIRKFQTSSFGIVHDEQKQFDVIFQRAFDSMKEMDSNSILDSTSLLDKVDFNMNPNIDLEFVDSKDNVFIQVSDVLAGVVMRFCLDFINGNQEKVRKYASIIRKLNFPYEDSNEGINYVVPELDRIRILDAIGV